MEERRFRRVAALVVALVLLPACYARQHATDASAFPAIPRVPDLPAFEGVEGPSWLVEGWVTGVAQDVVTLSAGGNDGIQVGQPLKVWRGPEYIATLEITQVSWHSSTARVVKTAKGQVIARGDRSIPPSVSVF